MTRRKFLTLVAGTAARPWAAWAQPADKGAQVGLLCPGFAAVTPPRKALGLDVPTSILLRADE